MNHKGTVTLETKRLILRSFELSDANAMFNNWANDSEVTKYLMWPTHTDVSVSKLVIDSWLPLYENLNHYSWAIILKEIGEPVGSIAAVEQNEDIEMVHIGYCIGRKWWRQGYTPEALAELIRFFFEDVGVNRIESRHDPRNPGSGKVMMKCGLRYEGISLQSDRNNQGICDAVNYALLAKDYFRKPQPARSIKPSYRRADIADIDIVTDLLCKLYAMERDELTVENKQHFADANQTFFLAFDGDKPIGISHGSLRREYVNGSNDGLKGYLEAIYVLTEYRMNGIAAELVKTTEHWAALQGCREFASDCLLENTESYKFHLRIGFRETERNVFFLKSLETKVLL